MFGSTLQGCFGGDDGDKIGPDDLDVGLEMMTGGVFQGLSLNAKEDLSVYIPYLIMDPITNFVQNSTVVDIRKGGTMQISVLAPPRMDTAYLFLGEYGRQNWPIRDSSESWYEWVSQDGHKNTGESAIIRVPAMDNSTYDTINSSVQSGGDVAYLALSVIRPTVAAYSKEQGALYSTGIVDGRSVYNTLASITDTSLDLLDLADGASGYLDRWAGQGNPAYEDGASFLIDELESFGLEVQTHRFEFTDFFGMQNPEAYNICGYKYGTVYPNEWLVFGAHFDVAPPANAVLLDPHITGTRTYGTRVGAYDNTAGTSMVLNVAQSMAEFDTRRTMVFCFWSGEEGGKRGSDYWTEYYVAGDNPDVTITNYVNLDMAGVNWPGGGGAPHGDPATEPDTDGYPKDEEVWPMRVYIGPSVDYANLDQEEIVKLNEWIGADAIGVSQYQDILVASNQSEDTWKYDVWVEQDRPEIIIYEDTTARSDHASFQDNLGTTTVGFGGLVDGYWCYHQTCDTLDEMVEWMDNSDDGYGNNNTGEENLVDSLDIITWWALYNFFHLDEKPIINQLA